MNTGIYVITNKINGCMYIGSAVNIHQRFGQHRRACEGKFHKNAHLQSAWHKYGAEAFEMRPILFCKKDDLLFYEQLCIMGFDSVAKGYNKSPTAGSALGIKRTPEYIAKMAAAKRGKPYTPERLAAHTARMNTDEVRARLSASCKAAIRKPKTPEHIAAAAAGQLGRTQSAETRAKLAAANLGKKNGPHSEETRRKISLAQKGRPLTAEHKAKLAIAQQRRFVRERAAQ